MSALQYLMAAHLFRQFQVASLQGEGDSGAKGTGFFFFKNVIVFQRPEASLTDAANTDPL